MADDNLTPSGGDDKAPARIGAIQTMSSREIAELTGKEHDNVRRDIKNMAEALSLTFEEKVEPSSGGRPARVYMLPKRETLILVSGYNLAMRAKIIDRWQELEAQQRPADPMRVLNDPAAMRGLLLTYTEKVLTLEAKVAEQAPTVAAFDRIANANGSMCITDAAKDLQIKPAALFKWLRQNGWIYQRLGKAGDVAYQDKLKAGYLEHKVTSVTRGDGTEKVVEQVRVTAKGLAKLARLLSAGPSQAAE